MKLSLVIPIYKNSHYLLKFLEKFDFKINKEIELIFVIDTNNEDPLGIIDGYFQKNKMVKDNNLKIIFNSKRVGRSKALDMGIDIAQGKYTMLISINDELHKDFFKKIFAIIEEQNVDIIEYQTHFKSPIKFVGIPHFKFESDTLIEDHPEILAFTFPFDFNKIFKTTILQKASKLKLDSIVNSRFSIEHTYKTLIIADSYKFINESLLVSKSEVTNSFNPFAQMKQWKSLMDFIVKNMDEKYLSECKYAFSAVHSLIIFKIVKSSKNKVMINKYIDEFRKILNAISIEKNNYYILESENEVNAEIKNALKIVYD